MKNMKNMKNMKIYDIIYMSYISVFIDNSNNSATNNPPGFVQHIGVHSNDPTGSGCVKVGREKGNGRVGVILDKGNSHKNMPLWYNEYGWNTNDSIKGPFHDGQTIILPKITPHNTYTW